MLMMENASRYNRVLLHASLKQRRSGYEPSDTESEWQETPWHDLNKGNNQKDRALAAEQLKTGLGSVRSISPLSLDQRYSSKLDYDFSSPIKASKTSPIPRSKSRSPYKPRVDNGGGTPPRLRSHLRRNSSPFADDGGGTSPRLRSHLQRNSSPFADDGGVTSPRLHSHLQRNSSPFALPDHRRCSSAYMGEEEADEENDGLTGPYRKPNQKSPEKFMDSGGTSRTSKRSNYGHRSSHAPKSRAREKEQHISAVPKDQRRERSPSPLGGIRILEQNGSPHMKSPPSEINEMIANEKLSKNAVPNVLLMESTDSIPPGDIFFSRDYTAMRKNPVPKINGFGSSYVPNPKEVSDRNTNIQQRNRGTSDLDQNIQVSAFSTVPSQRTMRSTVSRHSSRTSSGSAISRQSSSKTNNSSSKMSDGSGVRSESFRNFTANMERSQKERWFSCVRGGSCRKSKSPEDKKLNEASFIEKAFVVENLKQSWADKHRPGSLSGFICHKPQAQYLKQLISFHNCPHLLFRGPLGSGKKALSMALLSELFGASAWQISNDLRFFHVQENHQSQVVVPLTSSPHHVELNLKSISKNARYALMVLVKEITANHASAPEFSDASLKADYKVIVLYEVDKLADNVQHLIKWIIDCYADACKVILCCEDDTHLLESIKNRCKLISVEAPVTHEIMEVLIQIARKENFDLPMSFAAKIATKSKQNLRNAIMGLEACKAHNYPFTDEQPIPIGWEEVLVELAAVILADPSPKRLVYARGKFQRLLVDFVHPKLILQKLVEQFLRGVEASLKREIYYWNAYYDKRLPTGAGALLKLEEFVAKFMSIYRRSFSGSGLLQYK